MMHECEDLSVSPTGKEVRSTWGSERHSPFIPAPFWPANLTYETLYYQDLILDKNNFEAAGHIWNTPEGNERKFHLWVMMLLFDYVARATLLSLKNGCLGRVLLTVPSTLCIMKCLALIFSRIFYYCLEALFLVTLPVFVLVCDWFLTPPHTHTFYFFVYSLYDCKTFWSVHIIAVEYTDKQKVT